MKTTVLERRDRAGHEWRAGAVALALLLFCPAALSGQGPGKYAASRFDVAATVVEGGHLDVRETITFEFQTGTFRRVWREIPAGATDGIVITEARLDGRVVPLGDGPGQVKISGRNRIKVEWQFEPVGPSSHTFELRYNATGVVFRDGAHDVVRWRLLPSEHKYAIGTSRSTIAAAAAPLSPARIETRRVGAVSRADGERSLELVATDVRNNGWIIAELRYPAGSLLAALPQWQQRRVHAAALAPRWVAAAAVALVAALVLLIGGRQGYTRPSIEAGETTSVEPPEPLPAALASVLAAKGGRSGYQPIATIVDLADRGILTVREQPRNFGVRSYELAQKPGRPDLHGHELEALSIAFADRSDAVAMTTATGRLTRASRRFTAAVNRDLAARGYIDADRKRVRDRLTAMSIVLLIGAAAGSVAMATLIPRFEGWPFLIPFALAIGGIVGIIMAASTSPLSDRGLVQASRWRGFRRYLKSAVEARNDRPFTVKPRWIVYGIAIGLAAQWARYLKAHPGRAPGWFQAAAQDDGAAFAAFVGSHAATSSGGGGGGGGGAAGGGGSGAG